jgi:hypothetical protein
MTDASQGLERQAPQTQTGVQDKLKVTKKSNVDKLVEELGGLALGGSGSMHKDQMTYRADLRAVLMGVMECRREREAKKVREERIDEEEESGNVEMDEDD